MIDPQKLCQLELHSDQPTESLSYFQHVFGWESVPITLHEYSVIQVPKDCPFGISILKHRLEERHMQHTGVVPYFHFSGDIAELLELSSKWGGKLIWGPRSVPGYGHVYLFEDPGGIRIGVYLDSTEKGAQKKEPRVTTLDSYQHA